MVQPVPYLPVFELTRGAVVESIHFGAVAVVDVRGNLIAWYGDPQAVTFLRSTAKPLQALPFLESGGQKAFDLSLQQTAILCASHSGTDEHVSVIRSIQAKAGVAETDLLCGVHEPVDELTAQRMRENKEQPTPNRHNCSGKHTGMLAYARLLASSGVQIPDGIPYIDPAHPVQQAILRAIADMCSLPVERISLGIDGCSVPSFALPLYNAALAYARLCDPEAGGVQPVARQEACRLITTAMVSYPDMVGGPGRFDTRLMEVARGRMIAKGGAEAYQGIGLMPGALGEGAPAVGVALKISDGDARQMARAAVTLEVLRQLSALSANELQELSQYGPRLPRHNWRKLVVGDAFPAFTLERAAAGAVPSASPARSHG